MFIYSFDPDISDQGILNPEIFKNAPNSSDWGRKENQKKW